MKIQLLILTILISPILNAQIVDIPDTSFKSKLLQSSPSTQIAKNLDGNWFAIDANGDGEIQISEAEQVSELRVHNSNISNLSGIESFLNLISLRCNGNLLTEMDLSNNINLESLECQNNNFISLTIDNLAVLSNLILYPNNSLENLTITNNPSLTSLVLGDLWGVMSSLVNLNCSNNDLTSLNLSYGSNAFPNLTTLNCSNNQLSLLNVTNTQLVSLDASDNNLTAIGHSFNTFINLIDLNINNNLFNIFTVDCPSLVDFSYEDNPIEQLTFNRFSNNTIEVSNLEFLESVIFNYNINTPSIILSSLPSLNFVNINNATILNEVEFSNLPQLNKLRFKSFDSNLKLSGNLGFTGLYWPSESDSYVDIEANSLHITNISSVTEIDFTNLMVNNLTVDNMPELLSLKIPVNPNLQSIQLDLLPLLQNIDIGYIANQQNTECIDLNIENFPSLNNVFLKRIKLNSLNLSSLPNLTSLTNDAVSCSSVSSNFTLTDLPALSTAKILDPELADLNVNNLISLDTLEVFSRQLTSLNLHTLPELSHFEYSKGNMGPGIVLPSLYIQNFPNLNSIYLNRVDTDELHLESLPNLNSFISTNESVSIYYSPTEIDYHFDDLPSLHYIQLDQINASDLSFSNLLNFNTLKFYDSDIGNSLFIENLPLENIILHKMVTLNNIAFNNLPNLKEIDLNCNNIFTLDLGNINSSLEKFSLRSNFSISSNAVSSLDFTNYQQLNYLKVNYHLTDLVLEELPNLQYLDCSGNKFTALNIESAPLLGEIVCRNIIHPLGTNFELTLNLPELTKLDVSNCHERLKTLDLSQCPNIDELYFNMSSNPLFGTIQHINLKNGNSNLNVFESSSVLSICVDDEDEKELLETLNSNLSNTVFTTYCSFTPGGTFYNIQGTTFFDTNNDGCDENDIVFPLMNFTIDNGLFNNYYADNSGNYFIPLIEGEYTITPVFENPEYFNVTPEFVTVTFPDDESPFIQNFCVTSNEISQDLEVVIIPINSARPGFHSNYQLIFKNKGNQVVPNGQVTLNFGANVEVLTFVESMPIESSNSNNILMWNYENLQPFETRMIDITFLLNSPMDIPPLDGGEVIEYIASVFPIAGDANEDDNIFQLSQIVVNSFDPNDKTCLQGNEVEPEIIGEYVHYLIRFENTGTASAINVVIKDEIDTEKFDMATFMPLHSSHNFITRIIENDVEFVFENIDLPFPPSELRHGFVVFKIKLKDNLLIGDSFSNKADIHFDYNWPIITDEFVTIIEEPLSIHDIQGLDNDLIIFPNPVKDILNISQADDIKKIELFDSHGRLLKVVLNPDSNQINLNDISAGVYFIQVYNQRSLTKTKKFIKE